MCSEKSSFEEYYLQYSWFYCSLWFPLTILKWSGREHHCGLNADLSNTMGSRLFCGLFNSCCFLVLRNSVLLSGQDTEAVCGDKEGKKRALIFILLKNTCSQEHN